MYDIWVIDPTRLTTELLCGRFVFGEMRMEKVNYQLQTDRAVERVLNGEIGKKLLLHACCAPCSSYVLEYLSKYFDITVFFCNPNITDRAEYIKRRDELYRLCKIAPFCAGVEVEEDSITPDEYFKYVSGLENEPEGGARCTKCFELRLLRTAEFAAANGFDMFATTLTVSPHKNAALINQIGESEAERHGVLYLPSDFKKRGGYQRSIVLSKEYDIYRQRYCGCVFSEWE